jgi:hypothetical protein
MIVNYDSSIISKWSFKLIDDISVVIYDRNMFIIQATGAITFYHYQIAQQTNRLESKAMSYSVVFHYVRLVWKILAVIKKLAYSSPVKNKKFKNVVHDIKLFSRDK